MRTGMFAIRNGLLSMFARGFPFGRPVSVSSLLFNLAHGEVGQLPIQSRFAMTRFVFIRAALGPLALTLALSSATCELLAEQTLISRKIAP